MGTVHDVKDIPFSQVISICQAPGYELLIKGLANNGVSAGTFYLHHSIRPVRSRRYVCHRCCRIGRYCARDGSRVGYDHIDDRGVAYRIKGSIVPVALVVPSPDPAMFGSGDQIESVLNVRLGILNPKDAADRRSPRVLLACLPSISRLRGRQSTRWFSPSSCPNWHR